ncbi:MAG: alkaline phosphatase family protein, partial [Myxococcota bacterium]
MIARIHRHNVPHLSPLLLAALAVATTAACGSDDSRGAEKPTMERGLIILGVDGMDPRLLDQYIRAGKTPNLATLAKAGNYRRLGTTFPPQSPVAWSTFLTGQHTDGHGIFDFVHRNPHKLSPYLSTSMTEGPSRILRLGSLALPMDEGKVELLREGRAFWQVLEDDLVGATVVKMPANFPPAKSVVNESMSGMGTPDLFGSYGTFQVITDDPDHANRDDAIAHMKSESHDEWNDYLAPHDHVAAGIVHVVDFGDGQRARAELHGPPNPLDLPPAPTAAKPVPNEPRPTTVPVDIVRDRRQAVAMIRVGDSEVMLQAGEWSEWLPVGFDLGLLGGE